MQIDYISLFERGRALAPQFKSAQPFPSIVIDNFLDPGAYAEARDSFPQPDSDIWKKPENQHTQNKMVTKRGPEDVKELLYTEAQRRVLHELNSGPFLKFLSHLSGISGLVADPYYAEGGFHCIGDGGRLDIHADFSHHDLMGLERRLNLLLYLNDGWKPEYGGALSLYDQDLKPVVSADPIGNRAIIFATSDISFHGHPAPMKLPPGLWRKSIALYYYALPTPSRKRAKINFPEDPAFENAVTKD